MEIFEQTLVLLNGLRINDVQTSHHDLDLPLPTESLERTEILRGAGPTFYGSDAVGGTINFITGPPNYSAFRVGAAVGNFGINQESDVTGRWIALSGSGIGRSLILFAFSKNFLLSVMLLVPV